MNRYRIIGYFMNKDNDEWREIKEGTIIEMPPQINPYLHFAEAFKATYKFWLICFIKEE